MQNVHLDYWYTFIWIGFLWSTQQTVQNKVPAIFGGYALDFCV